MGRTVGLTRGLTPFKSIQRNEPALTLRISLTHLCTFSNLPSKPPVTNRSRLCVRGATIREEKGNQMLFSPMVQKAVKRAFLNHARGLILERADYPRLHKALTRIEKNLINEAQRRGGNTAAQAATDRLEGATKKLAGNVQQVKEAREQMEKALLPVVKEVAEKGKELLGPSDNFVGFPPELGNWILMHSLLQVRCVTETPPTPGKDDMLFAGTFTYGGTGVLRAYYHDFDEGEQDTPNLQLSMVQILPGDRTYTAPQLISEEDLFSESGALLAAVGIGFLLDLLIELGILAAKAALRAKLMSARPSNVSEEDWEDYVDDVLDELGKVAGEAGDDLIGVLQEWIAEALGPEVFPQISSEVMIRWQPPAPPVWRGVKCTVLSTAQVTVHGVPGAGAGAGTSVILEVPIRRSGGGDYRATLAFHIMRV